MTFDEWLSTNPADAEPDVEQVECDECGGAGRRWMGPEGELWRPCYACNGTGNVMVNN